MKKLFLLLAATTLTVLAINSFAHAISLSLTPASQSVAKGNTAIFTLNISGLTPSPGAPSLGAFDFNVVFNPAILSFNSATFGGNPGVSDQLQLGAACNPVSGLCDSVSVLGSSTVEVFELSGILNPATLDNSQLDSFILATLRFNTLNSATNSPLTLSSVILGDALGNPLSATLGTATITVTPAPTPEPNAFLLLGIGLIGLRTLLGRKQPQ